MATVRPTVAEVVARGTELYENGIRQVAEAGNIGRFIAIDMETGNYEIGDDHYETVGKLRHRHPEAVVCTLKIGYPAAAVIGGSHRPSVVAPPVTLPRRP